MCSMTPRLPCLRLACLLPALVLAGCAGLPGTAPGSPGVGATSTVPAGTASGALRFRCDDGRTLVAQLGADAVKLEGLPGGPEQLLRDAGGLTPRHTVYSSARLRAEFGLGEDGRSALLHPLQPAAATVRCVQA
jgi:hypothetical protein